LVLHFDYMVFNGLAGWRPPKNTAGLLVLLLALAAPSAALAYQWPLRPFDRQHAIRGNFDDPRLLRGYIDVKVDNPSSFHSGVDIQAPDGSPVYAIESGVVDLINGGAIAVASPFLTWRPPLVFGYWHVVPVVGNFQLVARHQLLGYVRVGAGHVHLSEQRFGTYVNPLRRAGLNPYVDRVPPRIDKISIYRAGTREELRPDAVSGRVDLVVEATDPSPIQPRPPWSDVVLSPERITWGGLFDGDWLPVSYRPQSIDFRSLWRVPLDSVYAPGSYQNSANEAGRYRFWLIRGLDTSLLLERENTVWVRASDVRDNVTVRTLEFSVVDESLAGP
jgi:hypothetical protein